MVNRALCSAPPSSPPSPAESSSASSKAPASCSGASSPPVPAEELISDGSDINPALVLQRLCFFLCPTVQSAIVGPLLLGLIEGAGIMLQRFLPPVPTEELMPAAAPAMLTCVPVVEAKLCFVPRTPGLLRHSGGLTGLGFSSGGRRRRRAEGRERRFWRAFIRPIHLPCLRLIISRPKAVPWVGDGRPAVV